MQKVQRAHKNDDNIFNRNADQVKAAIDQLQEIQLLNGQMITADLESGSNTVLHSLERVPFGWLIVQQDSGVLIYQEDLTVTSLILNASGPVTIKLWEF